MSIMTGPLKGAMIRTAPFGSDLTLGDIAQKLRLNSAFCVAAHFSTLSYAARTSMYTPARSRLPSTQGQPRALQTSRVRRNTDNSVSRLGLPRSCFKASTMRLSLSLSMCPTCAICSFRNTIDFVLPERNALRERA